MTAPNMQVKTLNREVTYGYTTSGGYRNTTIKNKSCSWDDLCKLLETPKVGKKDGPYLLRGSCKGKRADNNMINRSLVILDGDSSIDPKTATISTGAPDPLKVHEVLKALNITHCIYTSHSHQNIDKDGVNKGNRCRVVVPVPAGYEPEQLLNCVGWVIDKLHDAGLWINNVSENLRDSQPWYLPRIQDKGSEFIFLRHDGRELDVDKCCSEYEIEVPDKKAERSKLRSKSKFDAGSGKGRSFYDQFNELMGIHEILEDHGFETVNYGIKSGGGFIARLCPPGKKRSEAGVMVFSNDDGSERLFSHHGKKEYLGDSSGHAMDAVDVFCRLNGNGEPQPQNKKASQMMCDIIKERRFKKYDKRFYTVRSKKGMEIQDVKQTLLGDYRFKVASENALPKIFHTEPPLFMVWTNPKKPEDWRVIIDKEHPLKKWFYAQTTTRLDQIVSKPVGVVDNRNILRITDEGFLNTFTGWPCRSQEASDCKELTLIKFYLQEILCAGHKPTYSQLWGFMAHMVQYPGQRPSFALLLRGSRGAGKTVMSEVLRAVVGDQLHAFYKNGVEDITAKFSAEKIGKLVEVYDDISGRVKGVALKDLIAVMQATITANRCAIEGKGADKIFVDIFSRLMFTTNFKRSLPISTEERRFLILDVAGWLAKNSYFYRQLDKALRQPHVINGLVYELVNTDLARVGFDPNICYETPGLLAAKAFAYENKGIEGWFGNLLQRDEINTDREVDSFTWEYEKPALKVSKQAFQDDYAIWTGKESADDLSRSEVTRIGKLLNKYIPGLEVGGHSRSEYIEIAPKLNVIRNYEEINGCTLQVPEAEIQNIDDEYVRQLVNDLERLWISPTMENVDKLIKVRELYPNALKRGTLTEDGIGEPEAQKKLAITLFPELGELI